jgi:hypothetical protein
MGDPNYPIRQVQGHCPRPRMRRTRALTGAGEAGEAGEARAGGDGGVSYKPQQRSSRRFRTGGSESLGRPISSLAALALILAACATARDAEFTLTGAEIESARYAGWSAQCAPGHCTFPREDIRYSDARCRWTSDPAVADCRFTIRDFTSSDSGGPETAGRQLVERRGAGWVAIWPDETRD